MIDRDPWTEVRFKSSSRVVGVCSLHNVKDAAGASPWIPDDRTGEGKLFFNQVGDLIRGLGFKPTNKDVAGVLGNPKKEEMNTKTCNFDDFLGYVKGREKFGARFLEFLPN